MRPQSFYPPRIPSAFMSANWTSEDLMYKLFVEGLKCGVRAFDTAREYKTEKSIGRALNRAITEMGIDRKDIFVQSRISNEELQNRKLEDEIKRSVDNIGMGYLDCFMFHWPTPNLYIAKWKELADYYFRDNKTIRSIGLCNCRKRHLEGMKRESVEILPQIIQVEVQPFWQIKDLKAFCDENNILVQAFSPLCKMIGPIKNNLLLNTLAKKYEVSVPQIILKWHLQRGIYPISLTHKVERVKSNYSLDTFKLSEHDMEEIATLDCGYKYHLESATCIGF